MIIFIDDNKPRWGVEPIHATEWLFPGRQAGRHQHPDYLRVRLGTLGIDCRVQRRAALLQLASEVPASVLADMLNLSPSTAAKWVERAGGNWTNYVADRMSVAMVGGSTIPRPRQQPRTSSPRRQTSLPAPPRSVSVPLAPSK